MKNYSVIIVIDGKLIQFELIDLFKVIQEISSGGLSGFLVLPKIRGFCQRDFVRGSLSGGVVLHSEKTVQKDLHTYLHLLIY